MSNWLKGFRNVPLPAPQGPFEWRSIESVTSDTKKILANFRKLGYEDVSLMSWHPYIRQAQYTNESDN